MRLRRPSRKAVSATVAAAAVAVAVIATVSAKGGSARVVPQASAVAVEVLRPGQPPLRFATATAGRPAVGARAIAVPADGSLVRVAAARAGATTGPDAVAGVVAAVRVELLDGEVHPAALAPLGYDGAVNPTQYLAAWARGRDLRVTATPTLPVRRTVAGRPAAILLEADDR